MQDDNEWNICLNEASNIQTGSQLRHLFAIILLMCQPLAPELLWDNHKLALCEDFLYHEHQLAPTQTVTLNDIIENKALNQIEYYLQQNGMSLTNFPHMPLLIIQNTIKDIYSNDDLNQLINRERLLYNNSHSDDQVYQNISLLNNE